MRTLTAPTALSARAWERPSLLKVASWAATAVGAAMAVLVWVNLTVDGGNPADAAAYYRIDLADPYGGFVVGGQGAFAYSPAFAQFVVLLHALPFDVFVALWRAAELGLIVWLAGPMTVPVLMWGPALSEVNAGNVNIFIAAAIAAGFRYPGTWAFVLLTKVTPAVGLLWFAVRREWKALQRVALVTGIVIGMSLLLAPTLWVDWVTLIATNSGDAVGVFPYYIPLAYRLPVAVVVVLIGARLGWKATVAIGATIAAPVLYFPAQSILLAALPPIRETAGRWIERWSAQIAARRGDQPPEAAVPERT